MARTQKSLAFQRRPLLNVHIANSQKDLPIRKHRVRAAMRALLEFLQVSCEEVSLYFVSEKRIASLHKQFFNDPTPTDCITFPLDQEHLGEVFICPKIAIEYARKRGLDRYEETLLYLVHGTLHLIGYDDLTAGERRVMRKMEKRCMGHLKKQGISLEPISH